MKKLLITFSLSIFITSGLFAQKANLNAAWSQYKYDELDKAKKNIDQASTNVSTSGLAKTWYYKGLIYQAMYNHKVYGNLDSMPLNVAFESFKRSLEIEPKGENSEEILSRIKVIAPYCGVADYKKKNFAKSYATFDYVSTLFPNDTTAILYAAYSADYSGMTDKAIPLYNKLISMNFTDLDPSNSNIYFELASLYKNQKKDTAKAMEMITQGLKKYPDANNLIREQANLFILQGNFEGALDGMKKTIEKNPNDPNLHLVLATAYDNMANPKDAKGRNMPKPDKYKEYIGNAEEHYRKAIDLKADYFDAYFNLGALYFNQGADMLNEANSKKDDNAFKVAKDKAIERLKLALPYMEKAWQLAPEDQGTMISLKQIYVRTGDTEKYNKVKDALDKVKGK